MNTKNVLLVLIGIVSVAIIVALAVAVSVVRSHLQLSTNNSAELGADSLDTQMIDDEVDASVLQRMQRMHEEGDAVVTSEQRERMEQMNQQTPNLTDEEQEALVERMQRMRDAE